MSRHKDCVRTQSGRRLEDLTLDAVIRQELTEADFRISAERLQHQAQVARAAGYTQLSENLERAAELTHLSNEEVLAIYSKLRPGRASYAELRALGERLEKAMGAPHTAQLLYEAAEAYRSRGIGDPGSDGL